MFGKIYLLNIWLGSEYNFAITALTATVWSNNTTFVSLEYCTKKNLVIFPLKTCSKNFHFLPVNGCRQFWFVTIWCFIHPNQLVPSFHILASYSGQPWRKTLKNTTWFCVKVLFNTFIRLMWRTTNLRSPGRKLH